MDESGSEKSQPKVSHSISQSREQRRANKQLSCAECHRLKLKCDRQVPCSNCVRRQCVDICPNGIRVKKKSDEDPTVVQELRDRLNFIEGFLTQAGQSAPSQPSLHPPPAPPSPQQQPLHVELVSSSSTAPLNERYVRPRSSTGSTAYFSNVPDRRSASPPRRRQSPVLSREPVPVDMTHLSFEPPMRPRSPIIHFNYDTPAPYATTKSNDLVRSPVEESHGTLVIGRSGRSKWLGPTAGTEWLKNQEINGTETPARTPSPPQTAALQFNTRPVDSLFPFAPPAKSTTSMEDLMRGLPPGDEATVLVDSYYRYYTWNHDVAPRRSFQVIFDRVYGSMWNMAFHERMNPQELGLIFIVLAMGALYNPDLAANDASAEDYHALSKACLVKGDFLVHNTIAGVQTLIIMAHFQLETENGRNGDSAWPLWGLAMRLIIAMGLHRDGERWNLPPEVIDERRQVFWESHTIDVFQANCFSRPSSLRPEHIDTLFPSQSFADGPNGVKSFRTLKYELCRISGAVLDQAMDVRFTSYASVTALYERLCSFERQVPFPLRCRTALLALPSVYADPESAIQDSPDISRRNLHRTFQQYTLALNISETILFLQRPYFVRALQEEPLDPTHSVYGKSFLAVVERCNLMIQVVAGIYELYPTVAARHWFFWYHMFTASVCVGTMILKSPSNPLVSFALGQMDLAIKLYSSIVKDHPSPSLVQNHQWLIRLRQRALSKINHAAPCTDVTLVPVVDDALAEEDVELLGWRTRLIERAASGVQRAVNMPSTSSNPSIPSSSPQIFPPTPMVEHVLQQHSVTGGQAAPVPEVVPNATEMDISTDLLLQQFWDPTMLIDTPNDNPGFSSVNWWNWDSDFGVTDQQARPPP